MAFHSDLDDASNSYLARDRDRSEPADTCACPSTAELSKAVSVSLGLDTLSSPISNMNQSSSSSSAYPDFASSSPSLEFGAARRESTEGGVTQMRDRREGDFREVFHDAQQVSCMELLRSGDMESAQSVTRGPVISRYVREESNLFTGQVAEPHASSQVEQLLPLRPYPAYNPNLYRDNPAVWCAYGRQSEPERGGPDGHNLLCKYCGQAPHGSRQECHCVWYSKGDQGRKGDTRVAMTQECGPVESYQSVIPHGHATYSAVKTEPSVWVDCTDRTFR